MTAAMKYRFALTLSALLHAAGAGVFALLAYRSAPEEAPPETLSLGNPGIQRSAVAPIPPATQPRLSSALATPGGGAPTTQSEVGSSPSATASATALSLKHTYVQRLVTALQTNLIYPPLARARGEEGLVEVTFTISAPGRLKSAVVTLSSGSESLDAAALSLVRQLSAEALATPLHMDEQEVTIIAPLRYRLRD